MEADDDLFFAELSEQIALLIMDEEEEFPLQCQPLPVQGFQFQHVPQVIIPRPPQMYYDLGYKSESKGTGVFIPRLTTAPRKKNNKGGRNSNSNNANSQRKQEKNRAAISINGGGGNIVGQREKKALLPLSSH